MKYQVEHIHVVLMKRSNELDSPGREVGRIREMHR